MRKICRHLIALGLFGLVAATDARVVDVQPAGFTSTHTLDIAASPARVYEALTRDVGRWWDSAHSFSGSAENFSLDAVPGGCFCEQLPDGGHVRHMSVVYAAPGERLRLSGGLGPLQTMGVAGNMEFRLELAGPESTRLEYTYAVGGYAPGGLDVLAEPVDRVQLGQLQRLKRYVETGSPAAPDQGE